MYNRVKLKKESKVPLSVLIPTKNEEQNIADCIKTIAWANEIFILDSYSSDETVKIAKRMGANIVQRSFDNYSSNKNWALKNLSFNNKYLFILDADMRVSENLKEEICNELVSNGDNFGFFIPIKNYFNGKWIKHGGWYPNYHLMIFKHGCAEIEDRLVHAHVCIKGDVKYLKNDILHLDEKGIEHFIDRHNKYSSLEAIEAIKYINKKKNKNLINSSKLTSTRRVIKELSYKFVPCRSFLKFLYMYVIKRGFLDGRIGFRYYLLHAFYEYQVSLKIHELNDNKSLFYKKYKHYL